MTTDHEKRKYMIQGLRELADFLDAHPSVPITAHRLNEFVDTREEWDAINNAAAWLEIKTDDFLVLRRTFAGDVGLDVNVDRPRVDDETSADENTSARA